MINLILGIVGLLLVGFACVGVAKELVKRNDVPRDIKAGVCILLGTVYFSLVLSTIEVLV